MIDPSSFSAAPHPAGGVVCCGKRFASDREARQWLREAIDRRSKLLGRPIENMADFFGVSERKRAPMTERERIASAQWQVPMPAPPERGPVDDMYDALEERFAKPGSRERHKIAARNAARDIAEREARNAPPSKEVLEAREWAYSTWERALFDPEMSEAEFTRLEQLKVWAHTPGSDLSGFKTAAREFAKTQQERRDAKAADLQARRAELEKELASLPPAPVAPGDVQGIPAGGEVRKLTNAETGAVTFDVVSAPNDAGARRVLASYSSNDVPESIRDAAV